MVNVCEAEAPFMEMQMERLDVKAYLFVAECYRRYF
jgi:hypothetical protein